MTQEEILQYNKRCAEFLTIQEEIKNELVAYPLQKYSPLCSYANAAYICDKEDNPNNTVWSYCQFDSDWNWIMAVIETIEKLGETSTMYGTLVDITTTYIRIGEIAIDLKLVPMTKKEAVVEAINQFLIWYEQNKTI